MKHKNSILGKILNPLSLEFLLIGKTIWSGWAHTLTCCQGCGTHHIMIVWLFFLPFGLMPRISGLFMILGAKVLTRIRLQCDLPPTLKGNTFTPGQSTLQYMGQSSKGISNQHLFFFLVKVLWNTWGELVGWDPQGVPCCCCYTLCKTFFKNYFIFFVPGKMLKVVVALYPGVYVGEEVILAPASPVLTITSQVLEARSPCPAPVCTGHEAGESCPLWQSGCGCSMSAVSTRGSVGISRSVKCN